MTAPRAIEVIKDNVQNRPERYDGYHAELVGLISEAIVSAAEGQTTTQRRRDLSDAIKAKATTVRTAS